MPSCFAFIVILCVCISMAIVGRYAVLLWLLCPTVGPCIIMVTVSHCRPLYYYGYCVPLLALVLLWLLCPTVGRYAVLLWLLCPTVGRYAVLLWLLCPTVGRYAVLLWLLCPVVLYYYGYCVRL